MLVTVSGVICTMIHFVKKRKKKNGRLRLVLDARGCSRRFRKPLKPSMCGASALANLELDNNDLYCALSDIEEGCFYILQLPVWLQKYMCLPPLTVAEALEAGLPTDILDRWGKVAPALKVLPTSWSWSFYFCQQAHDNFLVRSGVVSFRPKLCDWNIPPPVTGQSVGWLAYVDNSLVCGKKFKECVMHVMGSSSRRAFWSTKKKLLPLALDVWVFLLMVSKALLVLQAKKCGGCAKGSPLQLSVVIGHLTFVWSVSRTLLVSLRLATSLLSKVSRADVRFGLRF
jgi:hypothetical protein